MLPRGLTQGTVGALYHFCLAHYNKVLVPSHPSIEA